MIYTAASASAAGGRKRPRPFDECWSVVEGGSYDLSKLLSANTGRSTLLDNDGNLVSFDVLDNKYVLVYFWCIPRPFHNLHFEWPGDSLSNLKEIYHHYHRQCVVVLVALGNDHQFEKMFSLMPPGYALSPTDKEARNFLMNKFDVEDHVMGRRGLIFDPHGILVASSIQPIIHDCGLLAFPFDSEAMASFDRDVNRLKNEIFVYKELPSFTQLLGQHVISLANGNKVLTSDLESESKIVAIFFLGPTEKGSEQTKVLVNIWESLTAEQRDAFVIVIVNKPPDNISSTMASFQHEFGHKMLPWYRVEVCGKKLSFIFEKTSLLDCYKSAYGEGDFIILKRDKYQPLSYFAFNIIMKYGAGAYPFTMERAVEYSEERQQNEPDEPALTEELMYQYKWNFERLSEAVSFGDTLMDVTESEIEEVPE